jgi:AcrR family transcriptional regulator
MSTPAKPSIREDHADRVRERLLDAAMALVERGEEPTLRAVAKEGGVAERTLYRYFESREALMGGMRPRFMGRSGIPLCERADQLEQYAAELFATFDANAPLIRAMLTSTWMAQHFRITRKGNLLAMRQLLDDAHPRAPLADRRAGASALRALLSGSGWLYLRDSCALPQDDVVAHAQWTVRLVLAKLAR